MPIYVLQHERGQKEIWAGFKRCMLDVIFEDSGGEATPNEAFLQAGEETPVQVGASYAERAEQSRVQEIEHLAGASSHNNHAAVGWGFRALDDLAGKCGSGLSLTNGGHVLVIILTGHDLSPGKTEVGVHGYISSLRILDRARAAVQTAQYGEGRRENLRNQASFAFCERAWVTAHSEDIMATSEPGDAAGHYSLLRADLRPLLFVRYEISIRYTCRPFSDSSPEQRVGRKWH
jgi:hypothetical protein